MDRLALDPDVEHLALEAGAAAGLAGHEDVGQEHHLHLHVTRALARLRSGRPGRLNEKVAAVYFRCRASGWAANSSRISSKALM